jgi:VanZ family protein
MRRTWKWIKGWILRSNWRSDPVLVLLVLWGLFIVYATLLPFDFSASGDLAMERISRVWARPLTGGSWRDVEGNVLLFVPWGLLLAMLMARRRAGLVTTVAVAMCSGAFLSGSVELAQLFAPNRSTSFIDLVTNSFGATVGAGIGWPWERLVWPVWSIRVRQLLNSRPLAACAVTTAIVLVFSGFAPFDVKPRADVLHAAWKAARWIPFGPPLAGRVSPAKPGYWAAELLTWALAGGLFALAARESHLRGARAIALAVAIAGVLSLAIETIQLVVPGRDVDLTSVVLAVLGSTVGAAVVVRYGDEDSRHLVDPAIAVWVLAVTLALWNPPRFTWPAPPYWRLERVIPFWSYFNSRTLADLADVVGQALIFMPLGALLAARSWRQSFAGALILGLTFGLVLEVGQAFLPDRAADISDAVSAAAGTATGLALWRWGEWTRTSSIGATRYRVGRPGLKG